MKNMKKAEIIISDKFQDNMQNMSMYAHLSKKSELCYKGSVKKVDNELYILHDEQGRDVCGILDQKSFMEALLETDVAHLWAFDNRKKIGTGN
ncbi:MAG: hypothetical protein LBQ83_04305 [Candidatus Margulisbacteria bacterium]|jgi:hypothetical protein|nr:hypothetical protein [Candidatus Margulisiibacteriota bacterium]